MGPTLRNQGLVAIFCIDLPIGPSTSNIAIVREARAMNWHEAHVMVTGGSSGIGQAVAQLAAHRGANLTLIARGADKLNDVANEIKDSTTRVVATPCDVSDKDALNSAVASATAELGPVDVLICSAGIAVPGRFLEADDEKFRSMMEINYFGTLWCVRAVAPSMVSRRRGSIVGVSSAAGLLGIYGFSAYGASKFAVRGMLESLRSELAPHGVHVGCCYPPDVDTPMLAGEEQFKPPETKAIAGTIKPLSAIEVAESILRGIDKKQSEIYADPTTRALARSVTAVPGIYRRVMDRKVKATKA